MGYVGNAPYNGIVNEGNIADNAVTQPKVADDAIGVAELSATGTPSSATFLRGDNSWATVTQTRISGGDTGLTPNELTGGDVTIAGTLNVPHGGTGLNSLTANAVILGNGTAAVQDVSPGASGNILTSNGTTWVSQAPAGGGVTSLNGQTGAITNTSFNAIGSYTAGTVGGSATQTFSVGTTFSGSSIQQSNTVNTGAFVGQSASGSKSNQGQSGTWRLLTRIQNGEANKAGNYGMPSGLFVRIS